MKTVVIFSHPNLEGSNANKVIIEKLKNSGKDIEVRHLDSLYADYNINVEAEQNALLEADVVVFQHPMFWYSVPPMLKLWMDKVLAYGFAYAEGGDKLKGKKFIHSFTTAGDKQSYTAEGYNNYPVIDFILPIKQTANLCQMEYLDPIFTNAINPYVNQNIAEQAAEHAEKLLNLI